MGQYYTALIIREEEIKAYRPKHGIKLMEHSWLTNNLTEKVMSELYDSPAKVAWIGDYANYDDDVFGMDSHEEYMEMYNRAWLDSEHNSDVIRIDLDKDAPINFSIKNLNKMSVINHSKKVYIDLGEYIKTSEKNSDWGVVFPISLLTACGNSRGCGDYHSCTCFEYVGTWAFDTIEVSELCNVPEGYKKQDICFIEN